MTISLHNTFYENVPYGNRNIHLSKLHGVTYTGWEAQLFKKSQVQLKTNRKRLSQRFSKCFFIFYFYLLHNEERGFFMKNDNDVHYPYTARKIQKPSPNVHAQSATFFASFKILTDLFLSSKTGSWL